jgi:hypothetical protein
VRHLEVERPHKSVPDDAQNAYVFEKTIPSTRRQQELHRPLQARLLRTGNETGHRSGYQRRRLSAAGQAAKKNRKTGHGIRGTPGWTAAMLKAHAQASTYVRRLPKEEVTDGRPPFVVVVDVGYSIELFSEFTRSGGEYWPFPIRPLRAST